MNLAIYGAALMLGLGVAMAHGAAKRGDIAKTVFWMGWAILVLMGYGIERV